VGWMSPQIGPHQAVGNEVGVCLWDTYSGIRGCNESAKAVRVDRESVCHGEVSPV
jgi:hypothetical protein